MILKTDLLSKAPGSPYHKSTFLELAVVLRLDQGLSSLHSLCAISYFEDWNRRKPLWLNSLLLFLFWRQHFLATLDWAYIHDISTSISQGLGLQVCTTTPGSVAPTFILSFSHSLVQHIEGEGPEGEAHSWKSQSVDELNWPSKPLHNTVPGMGVKSRPHQVPSHGEAKVASWKEGRFVSWVLGGTSKDLISRRDRKKWWSRWRDWSMPWRGGEKWRLRTSSADELCGQSMGATDCS